MVPIAASQIFCKHLIPAPPHFHRLIFFPNRPKMAGSSNDTEEFSGNGNSDGGGSASSPAVDRSLARAHTMPGGTKYDERREILSGKPDLERSRTEKHRQNFPLDNPTAQLFSDKIPDKEKV